jgi:hypothetical protein
LQSVEAVEKGCYEARAQDDDDEEESDEDAENNGTGGEDLWNKKSVLSAKAKEARNVLQVRKLLEFLIQI